MDIVSFAEQFLDKLEKLPPKYSPEYNAPPRRVAPTGTAVAGSSRKASVRVVEVALKDLQRGVVVRTRLSRTEPTLGKLRREASQMLSCPMDCVRLVQQGRVLGDEHVEDVAALAASVPVYVFDSREWQQRGLHDGALKADLVALLDRYHVPEPDKLATQFIKDLWQQS